MRESVVCVLQAASAQGLSVAGNQAVTVLSGGNVGIGTNDPQGIIDLGTGTSGRSIVWSGNGNNHYGTIGMEYGSADMELGTGFRLSTNVAVHEYSFTGSYGASGITIKWNNGDILFHGEESASHTEGDEYDDDANLNVVIKGNGNVGIGMTAPGGILDIVGDRPTWNIRVINSINRGLQVGINTTNMPSNAGTLFIAGEMESVGTLPSWGSASLLGIQNNGTVSDSARIAIIGGNAGYSEIEFGDEDDRNPGIIRYGHSDNSLSILTNAAEGLRITSAGNVGIGTTDPTKLLQVGTGFFVSANGVIGIGTNIPEEKLDIVGDMKLGRNVGGTGFAELGTIYFQNRANGDSTDDLAFIRGRTGDGQWRGQLAFGTGSNVEATINMLINEEGESNHVKSNRRGDS